MPPEPKVATAEGFTSGDHRPAVRGQARPDDGKEGPRRRAGEHGGERPEGKGAKPHSRKLPDQPAAPQPKTPLPFATVPLLERAPCFCPIASLLERITPQSHVVCIPWGEAEGRGEQSAPCQSQPQRPPNRRTHPTATGSGGEACGGTDPPARLLQRRPAGRTATHPNGRASC